MKAEPDREHIKEGLSICFDLKPIAPWEKVPELLPTKA
jgi:hypothetical protein